MKRNLVVWAKEQDIEPADPDSFFKSNKDHHKSEHDKKKSSWMIITREKIRPEKSAKETFCASSAMTIVSPACSALCTELFYYRKVM